jgi:hypothetical protein
MYLGNFSNPQLKPLRAGLAGLKATSYSIGGFISGFIARGGIGISSPKMALLLAKTPICLAF